MFQSSNAYKRLVRSYKKNMPEYIAFRKKLYPEFVFEKNPAPIKDAIPVFTLHSVEPDRFGEQLKFLSRNRYRTLTADEFFECIVGNRQVPERAIVLSFDDGCRSLWTVAYPLLKEYGFHAVSFIVPGLIREFQNGCSHHEPLCSWDEIRRMHDSGTIDFQSHSMHHCLIFTSPEIEDFIHPSFDFHRMNFNVPLFQENGVDIVSRETELGMPVYKNEPRLSPSRRYLDDPSLRETCIEHVRNQGGRSFFSKYNWRRKLIDVVENFRTKHGDAGRFESEEEQKENIYNDLLESKRVIESKLPGKTVRHLCYPWWVGSTLAVELSKTAGYLTNFWGIVEERGTNNRVGDDPYKVSRILGDEFILRLPGEGRKTLLHLLEEKFLYNYKRIRQGNGQ